MKKKRKLKNKEMLTYKCLIRVIFPDPTNVGVINVMLLYFTLSFYLKAVLMIRSVEINQNRHGMK